MATPIPENRVELSLNDIVQATGAEMRAGSVRVMRGVTTDTRGDVRGKLFVASISAARGAMRSMANRVTCSRSRMSSTGFGASARTSSARPRIFAPPCTI